MQFMKFDDWLGVMPGWLQALPESLQDIIYQVFQTFVFEDRWYTFFLNGLKTTFIIAIGALILGIIIGVLVAVVRSAHDSKRTKPGIVLRVINAICKLYLVIIRGTPVMVQLLLMGFVIMVPQLGTMEATWCAIITFGINSGAYVAEIVRSGIMAVDNGQTEAGRSLGFGYVQTMRYIVIPQAFKTVLPALANEFIVLLKETSVAGYVAIIDLTKGAYIIIGRTYKAFMPLIVVALVYLSLVVFFTYLVGRLERRLRNSDH